MLTGLAYAGPIYLEDRNMSQKKETTQPKTSAELAKAGLFKMSAEVDLQLYRDFQAACKSRGMIVKHQVEAALRNHLKLMEKKG